METLDRYLRAIRPLLPKAQRDDIVAELSEEIRGQIAEREAILGRPLNEAEEEVVLRGYGHPMIVGGRYQPYQGSLTFGRELIGPELFPFYVGTLKFTFAISTAMQIAIMAAVSYWEPLGFGDWAGAFALHFSIQFVVLTLVFCGLQSQVTRYPHHWNSKQTVPGRKATVGAIRIESVCEFLVLLLSLPFLNAVFGAEPASLGFSKLAPVWHGVEAPVLGAAFATMAQAVAIAFHPEWVRFRHPVRAGSLALWLGAGAFLLRAGTWVIATGSTSARQIEALNGVVFRNGLLIVLAFLAASLLWEIASIWQEARKKLAP